MTDARSKIVDIEQEGVYHCISSCVRRAYLCGIDSLTGKDYNHRKTWIRSRLKFLESIFAVDVLAYSIMCTHQHSMLRNSPDEALAWPKEEVATRWLKLFPKRRNINGAPKEPNEAEIISITSDPELLERYRWRLCDISWFMRCLNEHIAVAANKEDNVKGRFWSGRFKCTKLEDESAIATCMIYVDLNEVRAKRAKTPEESKYTSAYERIKARGSKKKLWLAPIERTDKNRGILSINLDEYLELLDKTGRATVEGKRGQIPNDLKPILDRLAVNEMHWLEGTSKFSSFFYRVAGRSDSMLLAASRLGQAWIRGVGASRRLFFSIPERGLINRPC